MIPCLNLTPIINKPSQHTHTHTQVSVYAFKFQGQVSRDIKGHIQHHISSLLKRVMSS